MKQKAHDIICLETDWLYNDSEKENRFDLKTDLLLNCLKDFHKVNIIHRTILHKAALEHYMRYLKPSKTEFKNPKIVYISCHGEKGSIHFEDGDIDLDELADMANEAGGFFNGRIVHFSSCKTLADPEAAKNFKSITGARLVCGYTKKVDAMKSAIADMALFNHLMYITTKFGSLTNRERSTFYKTYGTLLDELGFKPY